MDNRLQTLLHNAHSEPSLEAWVAVFHAAAAAGEIIEEAPVEIVSLSRGEDMDAETATLVYTLEDLLSAGPARGDSVTYDNKRARAKFKAGGGKVPHGTKGEVIWVSRPEQEVYGPKIGVKTAEGAVFFTDPDNVTNSVFAKYLYRQEVKAHIDKHWPRDCETLGWTDYPSRVRGYSVRDGKGNVGVIFWSRWRGADLRIGFKLGEGSQAHWVSVTDVAPA